jgi:hypothetical protein
VRVTVATLEVRYKSVHLPDKCPNCQASFTNRSDLNLEETVLETSSGPSYIFDGEVLQADDDGEPESYHGDTVLHYSCRGCHNWSTKDLLKPKTKKRKAPAKKKRSK